MRWWTIFRFRISGGQASALVAWRFDPNWCIGLRPTLENAIRLIAVHDLEPLHTWSRANVLLVGDAAHAPLPTSGQGACQALEDAWHLVRCLDGASGSLDEA